MSDRTTVIRAANTLSLAAWFGGSLMGLIWLRKASSAARPQPGTGRPTRMQSRIAVRLEEAARPGSPLDLDPFHTGPEFVPAGLVNRLRRPGYAGSRAGRGVRSRSAQASSTAKPAVGGP